MQVWLKLNQKWSFHAIFIHLSAFIGLPVMEKSPQHQFYRIQQEAHAWVQRQAKLNLVCSLHLTKMHNFVWFLLLHSSPHLPSLPAASHTWCLLRLSFWPLPFINSCCFSEFILGVFTFRKLLSPCAQQRFFSHTWYMPLSLHNHMKWKMSVDMSVSLTRLWEHQS